MADPPASRLCDRSGCGREAVMILDAHKPRRGKVKGHYPERSRLCPACVTTEVRVADQMGYLVLGEYL